MATTKKINTGQKRLHTGKTLIQLTAAERRLLSILVMAAGEITLKTLGERAFGAGAPNEFLAPNPMRANSWARNQLRTLVSEGYAVNLHTRPASYIASIVAAGKYAQALADGEIHFNIEKA